MAFPVAQTQSYLRAGGILRFAKRNSDGTVNGARDVGNVPSLTLSREVETSEHQESRSGKFQTDATFDNSTTYAITATLEHMVLANYAEFLGAEVEERLQSATPVTGEVLKGAAPGAIWSLGRTSTNPEGLQEIATVDSLAINGGARSNSTAVVVGQVVIVSSVAYVYTVAGTTGASAPTYPTAGGTVTDGTATLKHLGPSAVASTEYEVGLKPAKLQLKPKSTDVVTSMSRMPSGYLLDLVVGYTPVAMTYARLKPAATRPEIEVTFEGRTPKGSPMHFVAPFCSIVGSGESEWINAENPQSISLTITPAKRDDNLEPVIPVQIPHDEWQTS